MKFFQPVPVCPNPSDKLAVSEFLPRGMIARIGLPRRVWVGETPRLPEPDDVPPGAYWLKCSIGNAMQRRVLWPPTDQQRRTLETLAQSWLASQYGLHWGEWWYGTSKPRIYLERDLSRLMRGRPEIKVFVRRGVPKTFFAVRRHRDTPTEQSFFDADLRLLPGRSPQNRPLEWTPPASVNVMLDAAARIGKRFELVRVDFLNAKGDYPVLGEISLCHMNARRAFAPCNFDDWVSDQLFG